MITVVTTFSPEGYEIYGRRFVETFKKYWPKDVSLVCGYEGECPGGVRGFDLLEIEPAKSFFAKYNHDPFVKGKLEYPLSPWSKKARIEGYCFRHDAYKFSRKVFAMAHVSRTVGRGKLFFIDADVATVLPVSEEFLGNILPSAVSIAYLAREPYHSELGFVGYNLDRPETHAFISAYERKYADGTFYADPCWDDCNQFDGLIEKLRPAIRPIPHNDRAQPFDSSELGRCMTHFKGAKKSGSVEENKKAIKKRRWREVHG